MELLEILENINIQYEKIEHQAVCTVEDGKNIRNMIDGVQCKTLFLTDKKENYYLVVLEGDKKANIKEIGKILNSSHLTFGSEEKLEELLHLYRGSVTPFGIINDKENKVKILLNHELIGEKLLLHPNRNTATISIKFEDLEKFIKYENHEYIIF